MREKLTLLLLFIAVAAAAFSLPPKASGQAAAEPMTLTSTAFKQGENIPDQFTCTGANISPDLWWTGTPAAAKSLALFVEDPDAVHGPFTHWVVYNIVTDKLNLPASVPDGAVPGLSQGKNDADKTGYTGPCPPKGTGSHHYYFRIYALDNVLNLAASADKVAVKNAMTGHILAQAELLGRYEVK